jgi:hypothetical protein
MSMPKGFKSDNGYGTTKSLGGITYQEVASIMGDLGYKMNHSTARNVYVGALTKIAKRVTSLYDLELSKSELKKIAIDPRFQTAVSDFMKG